MADDERLHSRNPILRRRGSQRKPSDHDVFYYEVELAQWRRRPLPFQDHEIVAVKRSTVHCIALRQSLRDRFSNRTAPTSVRILPSKTVPFARRADNPLGILVHTGRILSFRSIGALSLHETTAYSDCVKFVFANAPEQNLLAPGFGVVIPFIAPLYDRDRKRPIGIPD